MASDLLRGIFFQNFHDGVTQQPVWRATDEDGNVLSQIVVAISRADKMLLATGMHSCSNKPSLSELTPSAIWIHPTKH